MTENQQTQNPSQEALEQIYNFAANQLAKQERRSQEVINMLVEKGIDAETAKEIVRDIKRKIDAAKEAQNEAANKDMMWGAIWCIGGIIATVANLGYVFWGAIVFGGFQFFQGMANRVD